MPQPTSSVRIPQGFYTPLPLDTAAIRLPPELLSLQEKLAEHIHDVWSLSRIEQGWTYGPSRNDVQRQHPCLLPYSQLPESEKLLDRKTAFETLAAIVSLGWKITPP